MKYLVKDLANITGFTPARIRKWQERYSLLQPRLGDNGYHYYDNDDLMILNHIRERIENGESISEVAATGREKILQTRLLGNFSAAEHAVLKKIGEGDFEALEGEFDSLRRGKTFQDWIRALSGNLHLVGRAWAAGYLSVSDEHAFSRWFIGYILGKLRERKIKPPYRILLVTFPGDEHELGALLHYALLLDRGISVKYCGHLPEPEICRELQGHQYTELAVSVVNPVKEGKLENFRKRMVERFPGLKIRTGGPGAPEKKRMTG